MIDQPRHIAVSGITVDGPMVLVRLERQPVMRLTPEEARDLRDKLSIHLGDKAALEYRLGTAVAALREIGRVGFDMIATAQATVDRCEP